ncbi:MAG: ABC transporter ATP-binding protein [Desulfobacula sp.]|jgi:branched-chain amino acid transport system ATP-binding protein|nr:ABC transporter ATP-binding protein [Desulfobacula sp.]
MKILEVTDIQSYYGKSHVLFNVSLEVEKGSVVGLIGRNGAGKSTALKSIIGIVPPASGSIRFKNKEIARMASFKIARRGIGYVPEDRRVFSDLTVYENLEIMMAVNKKTGATWTIKKIFELFPVLERLQSSRGMELSGGEQQMLTIARSLMANPEVLLLDEPTEGLAPLVVREIQKLIRELSKEITLLIAEQNLSFMLDLIDFGYIIDQGNIVFEGTVDELNKNKFIQEKYLGV